MAQARAWRDLVAATKRAVVFTVLWLACMQETSGSERDGVVWRVVRVVWGVEWSELCGVQTVSTREKGRGRIGRVAPSSGPPCPC